MSQQAMRPEVHPQQVTPQLPMQYTFGFALSEVLSTALDLDLFTAMGETAHTAAELAAATKATERGVRIILNALTAMKLIEKHGDRYTATPVTQTFLSRNGQAYIGGLVQHRRLLADQWAQLTNIVRTGKVPAAVEKEEFGAEFFAAFVDALFALNAAMADHVAEHIIAGRTGLHVLDIGAGSGVWGLAFLRHDPQAQLVIADFEKVIDRVTRSFAARQGDEHRVNYLVGDFHQTDFGKNRFDVVTLGHILHSEGERSSRALLSRVFDALRPGGKVVIAEFVPDEARSSDLMPLLFAVNMLVNTAEGDTFTPAELESFARDAGFAHAEWLPGPAPSPLLIATRDAKQSGRMKLVRKT